MQNFFSRIIKSSIYLLVFLLPLFWLPFSFEVLEFNKQYLLFFLTSLAFFCWLAKMVLVDKEIRFRRTPLDIPILAFLFVAVLSAVFSVDRVSSIFGIYGRFSGGLVNLLSFVVLYFLITNNVNTDLKDSNKDTVSQNNGYPISIISVNGILSAFLWSVSFVILFSYLSIFGVWARIGNFLPPLMLQRTFNPVSGLLEGLAVFLVAVVVFLTGVILCQNRSPKLKTLSYWTLLIASLFLLLIIDFVIAWIILSISLILFTGIALWKRIFQETVNRLLLPILLVILSVVLVFTGTFNLQVLILGTQLFEEPILTQEQSWRVGFGGATENVKSGLLGSGIGTFDYIFSKFRTAEFNQSQFWQIRFNRSGNHISEVLGTMGFLGLLSYLFLVGFFMLTSWIFLNFKPQNLPKNSIYQMPLLLTFSALLVGQFVYNQNIVLAFLFWLILGLLAVNFWGASKGKFISFKTFPELSLVFSTLLIILGILFLAAYFFAGRFYWADMNFVQSQRALQRNEGIQFLEKAARMNPLFFQYPIVLARTHLNEVLQEMTKPPAEQDAGRFQNMISKTIEQASLASNLGPNQVAAWETLGIVYREIRLVAEGSLEWGTKSFERAIELEPTSPVLRTELGKLYLLSGERERAKKEFERARELKPDYVDALIQLALLYEVDGNLEEAIRQMESLFVSYPFIDVSFHLGRLYFNADRIDDAIFQLEGVVNSAPNYSDALYSLGMAYREKGETARAITMFERVLELNPGNVDVLRILEELRE